MNNSDTSLLAPNPALLSDLVDELIGEEAVARSFRERGLAPGPSTGFKTLDAELGGFLAPGVHLVLAAPGAGKTALCLQIAASCGAPALYVSAEMRRVELMRRLMARETGEYLGRFRGGELTSERLSSLAKKTAEKAPQLALLDAQMAALGAENQAGVSALTERAGALRDRFKSEHLLVVVDSVTEWAPLSFSDAERTTLGEFALAEGAVNGLKTLAARLNCPVLAIAHRNRAAQGKDADRLHGAKGTGRYEYIAESVWDMERDKERPLEPECVRVNLTLHKNRYGAVGVTVPLLFEGRRQKFSIA